MRAKTNTRNNTSQEARTQSEHADQLPRVREKQKDPHESMAHASKQERRGTDLARGTQNPVAMKMTAPLENNGINRMTKGQQNKPIPYSRWSRSRKSENPQRPRQPRTTKTAQTTARFRTPPYTAHRLESKRDAKERKHNRSPSKHGNNTTAQTTARFSYPDTGRPCLASALRCLKAVVAASTERAALSRLIPLFV